MQRVMGTASKRRFEAFAAAAADPLFRAGYLMTGEASEAEDLVQETFIRVARRWPRVSAMDHPVAYARRILINLALDGAGRRSRHMPAGYRLTAATSPPCHAMATYPLTDIVQRPHAKGPVYRTPRYSAGMKAAASASGGCIVAMLFRPYTPDMSARHTGHVRARGLRRPSCAGRPLQRCAVPLPHLRH
jgi:hypothetical protein